ncbi:MAG: hypothetical protein GF418_09865 [Chitinivibrionales bacterium]|nr:hypothetical protein [Chitinivibrionales bacterium]
MPTDYAFKFKWFGAFEILRDGVTWVRSNRKHELDLEGRTVGTIRRSGFRRTGEGRYFLSELKTEQALYAHY